MKSSNGVAAILGIAAGVAGALIARSFDRVPIQESDSPSASNVEAVRGVDTLDARAVRGASVVDASALSNTADSEQLVEGIDAVLARTLSYDNRSELNALLVRLFELNPALAAEMVESRRLPASLLASVFQEWAQIDASIAISLLQRISSPALEKLLALAIIKVEGENAIDDIVVAASSLTARGLEYATFLQSASADPVAALSRISVIESREARVRAGAELGRLAAMVDPGAASMEARSIIEPELREAVLVALYDQWALTDVSQLLEHLKTRNPNLPEWEALLANSLPLAAESDPDSVLAFARETGGRLGLMAEASGLEAMAGNDPASALSYLATIGAGQRHRVLTSSIASGYVRYDQDAALAWVKQLTPRDEDAEKTIIATIASTDLLRGLEIELTEPHATRGAIVDSPSIPDWIRDRISTDLKNPAEMAYRIVASDQNGRWEEQMLTAVLSRWAEEDIGGALAWMQTNRADVPVGAVGVVAEQLGEADVERKIAFADMLPPERQGEWIEDAITSAATSDPVRAMSIANRYRTEPFYESMVDSVITAVSLWQGPEFATQLVDESTPLLSLISIGTQWVRTDPQRAASWALGLASSEAKANVVATVFADWAVSDVNRALNVAQGISDRELRERALAAICRVNPETASCD